MTNPFPRIGERVAEPAPATAPNQPPIADFTVSVAGHVATFTDTSVDVDGVIVKREWDYGDTAPPPATAPLPVGMWDALPLIGKGPGDVAIPAQPGGPIYGVVMGIPSKLDNSDVPALLALGKAKGVHVCLNLVHSPGAYCDVVPNPAGGSFYHFNWAKYKGFLDASMAYPELKAALARREASVLIIDEPLAAYYDHSIDRTMVNQMGRETKDRFPGANGIVRASSNVFTLADIPVTMPSGWDSIDYGIAQYGRYPVGSTIKNETPLAYYKRQHETCGASNVGIIPGFNLWGTGDPVCWDYQNTGSSQGRIHATASTKPGVFEACGVIPNDKYWVPSPDQLKEAIDAALASIYAPFWPYFLIWTHCLPNFNPNGAVFRALEARSDITGGLRYAVQRGLTRVAFNGFRPIKP